MGGTPLTLTCTLFYKWLPGCYKEKPVSVFPSALNSWDPTTPTQLWLYKSSHTQPTAVLPAPSHLSLLRLSGRESKQSLHSRNLGPNSAVYTTALVSIGHVKFNCTHKHKRRYFFMSGVVTVSIHCAPEMSEIDCISRIESFWPKFMRGW